MAILAVSMQVYTLQSKLLLFTRLKQQFHLLKTGVCNPYVFAEITHIFPASVQCIESKIQLFSAQGAI